MKQQVVRELAIPGLYEIDLVVHGDNRGWFKENYQQAKLEALGLPHFETVQNNISFNAEVGVTRGFHAEPWEKFISVATGKVFSAYLDLRQGPTFGKVVTLEITPDKAIFLSRGIANAYQTLEPNVAYTYLVNDFWSADSQYTFVNLFDPSLNVAWPISRVHAIISDKDANHPLLADITPMERD